MSHDNRTAIKGNSNQKEDAIVTTGEQSLWRRQRSLVARGLRDIAALGWKAGVASIPISPSSDVAEIVQTGKWADLPRNTRMALIAFGEDTYRETRVFDEWSKKMVTFFEPAGSVVPHLAETYRIIQARVSPGSSISPSGLSTLGIGKPRRLGDLDQQTRRALLGVGAEIYREVKQYDAWAAQVIEETDPWVASYLLEAYGMIVVVAKKMAAEQAPPLAPPTIEQPPKPPTPAKLIKEEQFPAVQPKPATNTAAMFQSRETKKINEQFPSIIEPSGKEIRIFQGHNQPATEIQFSGDGSRALSMGADAVRIWEVATGIEIAAFYPPILGRNVPGPVNIACTFSGNCALLLSSQPPFNFVRHTSADVHPNLFRLWNVETNAQINSFYGTAEQHHEAISLGPGGRMAISGSQAGNIRLWDLTKGREIYHFNVGILGVSTLAYSPDGERAMYGNFLGAKSGLWNVTSGNVIQEFNSDQELSMEKPLTDYPDALQKDYFQDYYVKTAPVIKVVISADGQHVITVNAFGIVNLFQVAGGVLIRRITHGEGGIDRSGAISAAFSPDGRTIATGGFDAIIRLWNLDGHEIGSLAGHTGAIWGLAFSPDGKRVLSAGEDQTIRLWDLMC